MDGLVRSLSCITASMSQQCPGPGPRRIGVRATITAAHSPRAYACGLVSAPAASGYHRHMRAKLPFLLVTPVSSALARLSPGGLRPAHRAPWAASRHALPLWSASWWASVAVAGVAVLAIVLLRRRPLTALALLLAGSLTVAVAAGSWPAVSHAVALKAPVLLAVPVLLAGAAVSFIAATRPRRISVAAAAAAAGVQAGGWVTSPPELGPHQRIPFLGTPPEVAVALITITAWLIGHSIRQTHAIRAQAAAQAATAERLRIARDLHDVVAHSIGIIALQAGMGRRVIATQPAEARDALAAIEATSRETLAGLRRTVGALRRAGPHAEPDLGPLEAPGLAGLARLAAKAADAGVRVEVRWRGQRRPLPAEVDTSAFRIIQEAVTNVVRHAGTRHCQVSIEQHEQELSIEVTDDGCGAAAAGAGYGITGMRERAVLLHGELAAGPRPGGGFAVTARLPLPAAAAAPPSAAAGRAPAPAVLR
jgi:signal transduction histidine kinase